jgi:hypothetical protein
VTPAGLTEAGYSELRHGRQCCCDVVGNGLP